MDWNEALNGGMTGPGTTCSLIIVGETQEGLPFCYEDRFFLLKADAQRMTVTLNYSVIHPLEKLQHVSFIEFSIRDQGILYYAFVKLLHMEITRHVCLLQLSVPTELYAYQRRRYPRIALPPRTPIACRIIGSRGRETEPGVAFTGQIMDISGGGLSFVTASRIFGPLLLELSFLLPDLSHDFVLNGEIVRTVYFSSDLYRIAVEFRDVPESTLHLIEAYCQEHGGK